MSDPIAQLPSELPGVIASAVQEVVDNSRGLGISWTLRMATIASTSPLVAIYDGDTEVSNVVSMIGPLAPTQRCYVLIVPPSGNFIVGCFTSTLGNLGANVSNGGVSTPAGGAETAVPSATWDTEPTYSFEDKTIYKATVSGFISESSGAGGAVAFVRLRRGSASITGTQIGLTEIFGPGGFGGLTASFTQMMYFKNTTGSVVRTKLSLTVNGVIGAGVWGLSGIASANPLAVVVESVGSIFTNPGLSHVPGF